MDEAFTLRFPPRGGKWWRFRYQFEGRENRLSLGVYPDVSLKGARNRRDEARKMVAEGIDPSQRRKARKEVREHKTFKRFEVVARE